MKRILSIFLVTFICFQLHAQQAKLMVEGVSPNLYLNHKVGGAETLATIASIYNLTAARIATYNSLAATASLAGKSTLKIPLDNNNFEQKGQKQADETLIPLYHMIGQGETLYRISLNHFKVPVNYLKEWNNLNKDVIWPGTPFIVGYLRIKTNQVAILNGEASPEPVKNAVVNNPVVEPVITEPAVEPTVKPAEPVVKKDPPKRKPGTAVIKTGYYTPQFPVADGTNTPITLSGEAATFKTTSGWQDKRFYALMNDITPGTIVKITTPDNKTIYAKVLGALPSMKENNGLLLRISNAAASELGIADTKFNLSVDYFR
jgi:LysM repeat protein